MKINFSKKNKLVYFVRHGLSVNNISGHYQGPDVLLSEAGEKQAEFVATRFQHLPIDVILASSYKRAHQTAEAIQKVTGRQLEVTDQLIERVRPSSFHNQPYDDPEIDKIREYIDTNPDPNHHHSDEENFFDVKKRAEAVVKHLEQRSEENIVVVSHGIFIKTILLSMMLQATLTLENFQNSIYTLTLENTAISIAEFKNGHWKVLTINDFAHLAE